MCNNPNLDVVNMNAYILVKFCQFVLKILSGSDILNEVLTSSKGHNSITNAYKMTCNPSKLDRMSINACTKFGEILLICSEDIQWKRKPDGQTDRQTDRQMGGMIDNPNPV